MLITTKTYESGASTVRVGAREIAAMRRIRGNGTVKSNAEEARTAGLHPGRGRPEQQFNQKRKRSWHLVTALASTVLLVAALSTAPTDALATTIKDAVGQAVSTNPAILSAAAQARASTHDLRTARSGYYPSLDLDAGFGPEDTNSKQLKRAGNDRGEMDRREAGLTARQLLWDGFATRSEVERRVALLNASEHSVSDTSEAIAFRAAESFLDVIRNRELVALARKNVASHEKTVGNVQARSDSGVGNLADVAQANARVALARSTLVAREGALRESIARYEQIVGSKPGELVTPSREPSGLNAADGIDQSQLSSAIESGKGQALDGHPAVLQSQAEMEAAEAGIKAAKAAYHPTLNLEGRMRRDGNVGGVEGTRNSTAIMLVARWNLFRGGGDRAQEFAAVERKTAAAGLVDDTKRAIAANVSIAYQARAISESRIAYLEQHVNASLGTLQSYRAQFELNRRTLLDVLNAENELFNARSNLTSGLFDDMVNQYFVEASKGQLRQSLGVSSSGP